MRTLLALIPLALCTPRSFAQTDVNKMIQERMAQRQAQGGMGGATMEDDNDPFVPNTFVGSFRMEIHRYENDKESSSSPMNMRYFSTADKTLNAMQLPDGKGQDMKIMVDLKNKQQYMLMERNGKRTAMRTHKKKMTTPPSDAADKPEITVTDETRTIEGHLCRKVIAKSHAGTWTGWVAEDVPQPFADMMRNLRTGDPDMQRRMGEIKGFPMEYEWVDANGKDRMVCYTHDLVVGTVDDSVFSLDGYEVMDMPAMGTR